jgi:hypothetical protein
VNPEYSALDRAGKFLFVPNNGYESGTTVSAFAVDSATAVLTEVTGSPFTTGGIAPAAAFVPNRFLYVTNDGPYLGSPGLVSGFTINPTTGFLSPIPGSPWSTNGSNPRNVTSDNNGTFLYVPNTVSGNVEIFSINENAGALTATGSVSVGFNIYKLVMDASNQFAYLGQIGTGIYLYQMSADSGSNFRIDSSACQYVYNLASKSLGAGTYLVKININNSAVGSATFGLR